MKKNESISFWLDSTLFSYGQLFFSKNYTAAVLILLATFLRVDMGAWGLAAVLLTNGLALLAGLEKSLIREGLLGMNSLLVMLGLSLLYQSNATFFVVFLAACLLTLLVSVMLMNWLGQYGLPILSAPFLIALWVLLLAIRQYEALETHMGSIYLLNELFSWGGSGLVVFYEKVSNLEFPLIIAIYFKSLAAILFQGNIGTGILIAVALLISSRISFTLSLLGYMTGFWFYWFVGADFSQLQYTNIGFNFILSSIAVGGFFFLPNWKTYSLAIVIAPLAALFIAAGFAVLQPMQLPIYSLPFISIVWLVLYSSHFQNPGKPHFIKPAIQQYVPEKNLYAYRNYLRRFAQATFVKLGLPFYGEWFVSQGHDGKYTHLGDWGKAWDFEIRDGEGKNYRGTGELPEHYYAYNLPILAPAAGTVVEIIDQVPDNPVGEVNLESNWGNAIVLQHAAGVYTMLGHLKPGSFQVEKGAYVEKSTVLAHLGNSGRSPVPHVHFQVQATPYVGSKTMAYPIAHYLKKKEDGLELVSHGIPRQGDSIFNLYPTPLLENAFHFIPGQELHFRMEGPEGQVDFHWEVWTDAWNQTYLYCRGTNSLAYFVKDDVQLYFTSFKGDRKSFLYKFYLGAFRVLLGIYKKLDIADEVPLDQVAGGGWRIFQDFLAPFFLFQKARYRVLQTKVDDPLRPRQFELQSEVSLYNRSSSQVLQSFRLRVEDGKLKEWEAADGKNTWKATWKEKPENTPAHEMV
ncbi:MAG: urea transporter [Lewinellaceae bacterium]|nr:urea transporter [Lewinellaceae bacterium]